ncbi:MAG: response regulator [Hyalangium sp.]|uniref:response regulator n=1 Tax=Hyalangium sp. TaxID=2028555 RepID=UPI003899FD37
MDPTLNEPTPPPSQEEQLRALLAAMEAANRGDFSRRLPVHGTHPLVDRLVEAFNTGVTLHAALASEVGRLAREVGTEGRLGGQARVPGLSGEWQQLLEHVNVLADSLTTQVRDMTRVATAVAKGDLSQKLTVGPRGEPLVLKATINTMVDQLSAFAAEVNRVAKEVGVDGKRGGLAELRGLAGIWKDLSDNVNVTEQLALASRYKSEFLANMSHELRTPLNSLLILAKVLSENAERRLSPREVEYAKTIHASGTDLLHLINEVLDLSKVEAGKMRVEPADVSLSEVKEFVERSFRHVAEHKGLGFSVSLGAGLSSGLYTDPQRLNQVLKNLLSNAFKFTHSGRVELRVTPVEHPSRRFESEVLKRAERVLAFSVVDTGIGIPADKQRLIFEAFQQADGTTSRKYGGTGLGLSISLAMTRLLGGELYVDSQLGQGSTFTLYLPQRYIRPEESPSDPASPKPEPGGMSGQNILDLPPVSQGLSRSPDASASPGDSLAGRKVLIVDDDIRNLFALTSVLENRGMEVLHAENGMAGLESLRAHPEVDAVLMDVMMPEMDGYETMRTIREDPRFAALPIIAITAKALKDDGDKCLAAGASDYLPKPTDTDRLLELLRRWMR